MFKSAKGHGPYSMSQGQATRELESVSDRLTAAMNQYRPCAQLRHPLIPSTETLIIDQDP
jgi:hypothetical protein